MAGCTPGSGRVADPGLSAVAPASGEIRMPLVADHVVVPLPGLGVDRLADRAEEPEALARALLHRCVALAHQRADRRRRGVEDRDLVLVDRFPEAAETRVVRHALEHHAGRAGGQRPVDDIAVARHPADVGGAPEDVVLVVVEDGGEGEIGVNEVSAGRVQHALRLAGGAGGVQDEQRVFRVHALGLAFGGLVRDDVLVPDVAALDPVDRRPGIADDDHFLDAGQVVFRQRGVHVRLERDLLAAPHALVSRDDEFRVAVADAAGERVRRKTAENDGVNGADAGAGEHRDRGLRDHRHVDGDAVALGHALRAQRVGEAAHPFVQFAVGDGVGNRGVVAFEQQRGLVAAGRQLAVEAVDRHVELAVLEPADAEIVRSVVDVPDLCRKAHPVDALGNPGPEGIGVAHRFLVHRAVIGFLDDSTGGKRIRHWIGLDHHLPSPVGDAQPGRPVDSMPKHFTHPLLHELDVGRTRLPPRTAGPPGAAVV
jgi:hypothetical protein